MPTWNVTEIWLEANYIGRRDAYTAITVSCQSLSYIPPKYISDIAADGGEMRSKVPGSEALEARGIDVKTLDAIQWDPTHIRFRDSGTSEQKEFGLRYYETEEPDRARFVVTHEIMGHMGYVPFQGR